MTPIYPMTKRRAEQILQRPKFGDPEAIAAVKFLEDEAEAEVLRKKLKGKQVDCWCCEGRGELSCKAGCVHECPTCEGEDKLTLRGDILRDLDLLQLRDLDLEAQP